MSGILYLCGTPIGNLEDMTFRAVRTLKEADLIAAEDTRNSIKLLNHFEIHTPMTSYHEYNKIEKGRELVEKMRQGMKIALITDAGMPGISDPGEELTAMALEAGIPVTAVPGPAACVTGLVLSGLPSRRFAFEAFLPQDKKERREILRELKEEFRTTVLYEAPHRLLRTLEELREVLGESRRAAVCRELTKKHETLFRGTLGEACAHYRQEAPRGGMRAGAGRPLPPGSEAGGAGELEGHVPGSPHGPLHGKRHGSERSHETGGQGPGMQ